MNNEELKGDSKCFVIFYRYGLSCGVTKVTRKLDDAIRFISEITGISRFEINQNYEMGKTEVFDRYNTFYYIEEHPLD